VTNVKLKSLLLIKNNPKLYALVPDKIIEKLKSISVSRKGNVTFIDYRPLIENWLDNNLVELENAAPISRYIMDYLNSPEVLKFLSELTGIENLIPDNTFFGGGIHKISKGGKLAVHADYSFHRNTGHHRRINLLLYLNKNWQSEWNGNLELWSPDMSKKIADIEPLFNRAVIFNITNDALHGHPKPLNTPENVDRYSFALYYFTENRPKEEIERNLRDGDQSSVLWVETPEETVKRDLDLDSIFKV
jgi:hypothetical protein